MHEILGKIFYTHTDRSIYIALSIFVSFHLSNSRLFSQTAFAHQNIYTVINKKIRISQERQLYYEEYIILIKMLSLIIKVSCHPSFLYIICLISITLQL